ncbi:hypothetical protein MKZ38_003350 [Zalerion maritima]|uniref:Zn(2)-C6 fungal-type domain-containing protein n=1 Tax=Zalerion maritima TaxID=339359 RepID=A0AAD5RMX2_9PEZI|nr:hypothetical protein MKZ38_003350 [Zalerion maritima]
MRHQAKKGDPAANSLSKAYLGFQKLVPFPSYSRDTTTIEVRCALVQSPRADRILLQSAVSTHPRVATRDKATGSQARIYHKPAHLGVPVVFACIWPPLWPRLNSTPPAGLPSVSAVPPVSSATTSVGIYHTSPAGGLRPHISVGGTAPGDAPASTTAQHPLSNVSTSGHAAESPGCHHGGIVAINAGGYQMGGPMGQHQQYHGSATGGQGQMPSGGYQRSTQRASPAPAQIMQQQQQRAGSSESPTTRPSQLPTSSQDASARKAKQVTPTTDPTIYSDTVRKGISNHSRTGQACDRCKVRKIRCDQAPDQCTNCRNQNLECLVTDRTTGRTVRRDYLTELEKRMTAMENTIKGMGQLLRTHANLEVKPFEYNPVKAKLPVGHTVDDQGNMVPDLDWHSGGWTEECGIYFRRAGNDPSPAQASAPAQAPSLSQQLQLSRPSTNASQTPSPDIPSKPFRLASDLETVRRPGLHLGIMPDAMENRSALMGTHLAVLGFAFNLADDSDPDVAEPDTVPDRSAPPVYNKSVRSLLRSIYHRHEIPELELPSYETSSSYSQWYFLVIHPFLPLIHKPSYTEMLKRFYEPGFVPEAWQVVQVHMVLAIIYYQIGTRNWEKPAERDTFVDLSNKHYHIALSKVSSLQMEPSFDAVQALSLISAHARSFPKPGAALHIASKAFNMAVDISLHREIHPKPGKSTNLHLEMRKRVWWGILVVIVTLCGRLGKPMPISGAEFDVTFPEPIPEECLLEHGVDMTLKREPCHYVVGLAGFHIIPLYLEMFANLYAVKFNAARYSDITEALEAKLDNYMKWIPDEIRVGVPGPAEGEGKVAATYAHLFGLEYRLCLRHPAVNESASEEVKNANIKICRDVCREIYRYTVRLMELKSLDTTFYQVSIYLLCLMTILSAVHKERHTLKPHEYAEFKEEVEGWLRILQEIWKLMGTSDASLRPLLHLVKSGLEDTPQKAPIDQAALFRHVLQDILEMRKEPKAATLQGNAPDPLQPVHLQQLPRHQEDRRPQQGVGNAEQARSQYQRGSLPHVQGAYQGGGGMNHGATMLDLALSPEQLAAVGMTDGISWFPVPPGYTRTAGGIIMPMENVGNNDFAPQLPAVGSQLSNMPAGGSSGTLPVSHASSGWPLLIFDRQPNTSQQGGSQPGSNNAADYGQSSHPAAPYT